MNGIERIIARIESEARAEAEQIASENALLCDEIVAEADKTAQEKYWELVRAGVKDCEARVQRLGSTAAMEAKKSILTLKQEMVSLAFDRAVEQIVALPEGEYVKFLASLADGASRTGREEIVFNEADKKRCGAKVVKAANALLAKRGLDAMLTVSDESRDLRGGLVVKEGDIECNCSIETLIEQRRGELATQVADALFN